jgi:hypothetical protein
MPQPNLTTPAPSVAPPPSVSAPAAEHRPNLAWVAIRGLRSRHWTFTLGTALLAFVLVVLC